MCKFKRTIKVIENNQTWDREIKKIFDNFLKSIINSDKGVGLVKKTKCKESTNYAI